MTLHDPVDLRLLPGRWVHTLAPITWRGRYPNVVPAGFVSDGGTIPALVWPLVGHPLSNGVCVCYLLHDLEIAQGYPWRRATARFNARLAAVGCHPLRRWAIIGGVIVRGWWKRITR